MAQFVPSKKALEDFNNGEQYLNRIDVVQAETVNNLVEGLLYAQESGGGTTMLTEGREFGKELFDNDYFLEVTEENEAVDGANIRFKKKENASYNDEEESKNALCITECRVEEGQELIINSETIDENNMLKIGE